MLLANRLARASLAAPHLSGLLRAKWERNEGGSRVGPRMQSGPNGQHSTGQTPMVRAQAHFDAQATASAGANARAAQALTQLHRLKCLSKQARGQKCFQVFGAFNFGPNVSKLKCVEMYSITTYS